MRRLLIASCLLSLSVAAPALAQPRSWTGVRELVHTPGVSGFETEVREAIRGYLPGARTRVDEAGNLIATFGQGAPHVLLCADMDEDGFFVSGITDEGYLRLHRVTTGVTNRLFEQMHYGQPIVIQTRGGHVNGVIATASTHLQRGRDQAPAPKGLDDLWVDVGASSKAEVEKLGIRMLDPISLRERVQQLEGTRLAGVAAQTRALDYALRELASRLDARSLAGTITIAWTARGSFGGRGMQRLAQEIDPDRVIVLGRTPMARSDADPKGAFGQLGAGPLVAASDAKTIEAAKQRGVPVQPVAGVLSAPNAWPGANTQVLSVPVRYAQTPVECIDTRDADALVPLLFALTGASAVSGGVSGGTVEGQRGARPPAQVIASLEPLIAATAVSGAEAPVRELVLGQLPKWAKPEVDRGNVIVTLGKGGKELLFVAHMDEIGYAITDIRDDGTASVAKRGGFFDYLWEAHPVFVQTSKGVVPAIVAPRPGYSSATTAAPRAEDIVLYFGTTSRAETEALGVAKADTATIGKALTPLAGSRWTARSMDDRCGVATLIAALHRIDPAKVPNRVTFAFVTGEETGLVGSGLLAARLHPAVAFAIDTFVSSDSPVDPQRLALVPLGSGAVARAIDSSSITPPDAVARIVSIGRAHNIPVVVSATSGGNDGSQFGRYGSIVAPLSWPGRYSHSPVEVMDLRDLENLVGLVVALAHEF